MKKITITIALAAAILSAKAQDTTCTMFQIKRVIEFDYQVDTILYENKQNSKYYDIFIKHGDVLCLHFYDDKSRTRRVITTFLDGSTTKEILDSKDNVYYSPQGAVRVSVSKPKFFCRL